MPRISGSYSLEDRRRGAAVLKQRKGSCNMAVATSAEETVFRLCDAYSLCDVGLNNHARLCTL